MRVTTIGSTGSVSARLDRPRVRPAGAQHAGAGGRGVVGRVPQLRPAVVQPQPARRAVALVGQPDAARVEEAHRADPPVVLLMGVPADDDGRLDARRAPPPSARPGTGG